ncbi:hypothetical protein SAY87_003853 [Trapa incisa]|uniref:Uncharacterized protein n=1 Tax=Trapa incisa TaxID=236973 RepID=A0AAN7KTA7_9MYRT|nr:hypothetical protein SAY87_003853 [Trapa incisa]
MSSDSFPLNQPPPLAIVQPNYTPHTVEPQSHSSLVPLVAVLVVVSVLGVVAAVVGRLCTGKRIMGYGHKYDMESWAENKCSSCIDGRILVSTLHPCEGAHTRDSAPSPVPNQVRVQERPETEQTNHHCLQKGPSNASSSL